MNQFQILRQKVVFDVLDRFPDAGTRTIASKVYNENSALFKDAEQVRRIMYGDFINHFPYLESV